MAAWIPAVPTERAHSLGAQDIHVWRMDYERSQGHAPFRTLLASYLGASPDTLVFGHGTHGRPFLARPHSSLDFNWSHSGSLAVIAVARNLPRLGVDFERHRARPRALPLAQRFFDPDEYARLCALLPEQQEDAFLRLWTTKEAVLKAIGRGIGFGLNRVTFNVDETSVTPEDFAPDAGPTDLWHLQRIDDTQGYACLAWRDDNRHVHWFSNAR